MATFTLHRIAATAITALAVAVTTLSLAACSSGGEGVADAAACAQMSSYAATPGAPDLVIVLDHSKSTRDVGLGAATTAAIGKAAALYGTLSVLQVDGGGAAPRWLVDNLPLNNSSFEFDTLHYNQAVKRAPGCVERKIADTVPTAPGTDLGTAIQVAADRLGGGSGTKQLIVESDGLSNVGPIDLNGVIAQAAVDTAVARLDTEGYKPVLSGVDVSFNGLGVTSGAVTSGPTVTWLRNYYEAVCKRAGGAQCAAPAADQGAAANGVASRTSAPADPALALPAVSFELTDSEVHFDADSTTITAAADGALQKVAACVKPGVTLTVIGHASSDGDAARNQALSDGRARAVAQRILQLAGDPTVTVDSFGVGSSEPKTATGDQPADRRVDVSLTGACS